MTGTATVAPEGVTEAINRAAVEARAASEPTWLRERRLHAWQVYEATPMPTTALEQWRYTDLRKTLKLDALTLGSVEARPDDISSYPAALRQSMNEDRAAAGHLVLIDGTVVHTDIQPELASKGVVLTSLRAAVESHPELVEKYLATEAVPAEEGKFAALNAALWSDGIFLYVPKGVHLDLPVRVTRWVSEAGAAFFTRTLIVAEPTSQVSYVDEILPTTSLRRRSLRQPSRSSHAMVRRCNTWPCSEWVEGPSIRPSSAPWPTVTRRSIRSM